MSRSQVGVIVGRFQTTKLHAGHLHLLIEAARRHKQVLILLGCTRAENSKSNPLDYVTRKMMISGLFKNFKIRPLWDMPEDGDWSMQIDGIVKRLFPNQKTILYGSRDSCLKYYSGKLQKVNIKPISDTTATALRDAVRPKDSKNFREGATWKANQALAVSFQAVDIIIVSRTLEGPQSMLLGRKKTDPSGQWRFPGGFVDPKDTSLEVAAYREAQEEIGEVELGGSSNLEYLGSLRVDDWRYKKERNTIMTAVYLANYQYGNVKASDDLAVIKWFELEKVRPGLLVKSHRAILRLFNHSQKGRK